MTNPLVQEHAAVALVAGALEDNARTVPQKVAATAQEMSASLGIRFAGAGRQAFDQAAAQLQNRVDVVSKKVETLAGSVRTAGRTVEGSDTEQATAFTRITGALNPS
jgi:uncharacterized protein YukE